MHEKKVHLVLCLKSHDFIGNSLLVMNIFLLNHDLKSIQEKGKAFS